MSKKLIQKFDEKYQVYGKKARRGITLVTHVAVSGFQLYTDYRMRNEENHNPSYNMLTWWSWYLQTFAYPLIFYGGNKTSRLKSATTELTVAVTLFVNFAFLWVVSQTPDIVPYDKKSSNYLNVFLVYMNWVVHHAPPSMLIFTLLDEETALAPCKFKTGRSFALSLVFIVLYFTFVERNGSIKGLFLNNGTSNVLKTYRMETDREGRRLPAWMNPFFFIASYIVAVMGSNSILGALNKRRRREGGFLSRFTNKQV